MRLLLLGDSWGVGEYSHDSKKGNYVSHGGLSEYLREQGCTVNNLSCPADNNIRQLRLADEELSKNTYDKVIWVQTEPLRNIYRYSPFPEDRDHWNYTVDKPWDDIVQEWFTMTYDKAQEISNRRNARFILIGGLNRVHPIIENYSFHDHIIWSWSEELVGHAPPYNTHWHTGRFIEDNIDKLDEKRMYQEMKHCRFYEDQQEASPRFQARHPNREAHRELAVRLLGLLGK